MTPSSDRNKVIEASKALLKVLEQKNKETGEKLDKMQHGNEEMQEKLQQT